MAYLSWLYRLAADDQLDGGVADLSTSIGSMADANQASPVLLSQFQRASIGGAQRLDDAVCASLLDQCRPPAVCRCCDPGGGVGANAAASSRMPFDSLHAPVASAGALAEPSLF